MENKDFFFMKEALKEANKAFLKNEVPVGAIAVLDKKIVARAHNNTKNNFCFSHAEFLVLNKLNRKLKNCKFKKISIYSTLEPCIMCMGALIQMRIKKLYYGASNFKCGFIKNYNFSKKKTNLNNILSKISIKSGLFSEESSFILKKFFFQLRKKK
jgi:cytosine deaminase/tRNA(adenine34) deaminase